MNNKFIYSGLLLVMLGSVMPSLSCFAVARQTGSSNLSASSIVDSANNNPVSSFSVSSSENSSVESSTTVPSSDTHSTEASSESVPSDETNSTDVETSSTSQEGNHPDSSVETPSENSSTTPSTTKESTSSRTIPSYREESQAKKIDIHTNKEEAVKIPYPVHYESLEMKNGGTTLNTLFSVFGKAKPFDADSTASLLDEYLFSTKGGVTGQELISLKQDFEMEGTIFIRPINLTNTDNADGFSIGFHGDNKDKIGEIGQELGMKNLKNGYFFSIDLHENNDEPEPPFYSKSITDDNGDVHTQHRNKLFQTNDQGVREEGIKALFIDHFPSEYGSFTPFHFHFSYDKQTRTLSFNFENGKGEEQVTDGTFKIPENQSFVNFYAIGVTGGQTSKFKLQVSDVKYTEYKTNTPKFENFSEDKKTITITNPEAQTNPIEPLDYPKGTKIKYQLDGGPETETTIDEQSSFKIDNLNYGDHTITFQAQTPFIEGNRDSFARYSDAATSRFTFGSLTLKSVPTSFDFGKTKKSPSILSLKGKNNGDLLVIDTRMKNQRTNWELFLKEEAPLINDLCTLTYVNRDNDSIEINNANQKIEHNLNSNTKEDNISKNWNNKKNGLFLNIPPEAQKVGDYSGKLEWTLQNVPTID